MPAGAAVVLQGHQYVAVAVGPATDNGSLADVELAILELESLTVGCSCDAYCHAITGALQWARCSSAMLAGLQVCHAIKGLRDNEKGLCTVIDVGRRRSSLTRIESCQTNAMNSRPGIQTAS